MPNFGTNQVRKMLAVGAIPSTGTQLWLRGEAPGEHRVDIFDENNQPLQRVARSPLKRHLRTAYS